MNIHIDADNVRFRYPEGLRLVFDGSLDLRGNWASPRLEGRVQIESLSYRSGFEEFLALLTERNLNLGPSPAGRLQLIVHIEGCRYITIQCDIADVDAHC